MSEPPPPSPRAAPALAPARLKRRSEFLRVAARGKRAARPGLVLQAMRAGDAAASGAPPRLGFTVTKKVGNAVTRNRVRRRLKEAARLTFRDHPEAARGWDLVLIGREGTVWRDFAELRADLESALRQLGAWAGAPSRPAPRGGDRTTRPPGASPGAPAPADATPARRRPAAPSAAPGEEDLPPPPAAGRARGRGPGPASPAAAAGPEAHAP